MARTLAGISVFLFLLLPATVIRAQEEDELTREFEFLESEDVVYTPSKHGQDIAESPSAITVLSREEIENTYCSDVVCLLREIPEVDVIQVKPLYAAVGARALTDEAGERVLVLVDGREINNELFGVPYWQALPVHLEDIERIEVIRGPGSALYGANAHSMVVSIFTRKIEQGAASAYIGSGEHDRSSLNLRLGQLLGDFRLQVNGGLETEGHARIQGDRERELGRIRLHLDRETEARSSSAQLGLLASPGGPVYCALGPAEMRDILLFDVSASHRTDHLKAQLSFILMDAAVYIEVNEVNFEGVVLGEVPAWVPFLNTDLSSEVQTDWEPFAGNLLIAGGGYRWLMGLSDGTDPSKVQQHRIGFFVHDEQKIGERLRLTGGVRLDYNSITPFTVSPRFAGVWQVQTEQFVRLTLARAFRKPSFFNSSIHLANNKAAPGFPEFVDFMGDALGNKDLQNENITSLEAGYRGRFLDSMLSVEADLFYNRYRDTIILHENMVKNSLGLPDLKNSVVKYFNTGRDVDSVGGSLSLSGRMDKVFRAELNYTFRHSMFISNPSGVAAGGGGKKGDRVPWEPAHLANLSFAYLPETGPRVGLGWHGVSGRQGYTLALASTVEQRALVPMPASWFLSAFVSWKLELGPGPIEVGVRATNLLNLPYREMPGLPWSSKSDLGERQEPEMICRRVLLFIRGSL